MASRHVHHWIIDGRDIGICSVCHITRDFGAMVNQSFKDRGAGARISRARQKAKQTRPRSKNQRTLKNDLTE
ncbi:MAG: hypothetical protein M0R06_06525 [Sphaerochaeta sp.]|jgi:hypothetical protein|nr:hypothetical protein [Sphaerochaeta sp.]MDD4985133.1 hypothetical protein [Dehalococcoidales bacterium]